jgi:flagellar assembly factor FliW
MLINTTRFGQVQIESTDILNFSEGLLGFADLRTFVILDDPTDDIFAWMQSCEQPAIAFPILEPEIFNNAYHAMLSKADLAALNLNPADPFSTFTIVTIPDDPTLMTANLKAPVIVNLNGRHARQCVLQDNSLAIREPIFAKLQSRVVSQPTVSIKSLSKQTAVIVPIRSHSEPTL